MFLVKALANNLASLEQTFLDRSQNVQHRAKDFCAEDFRIGDFRPAGFPLLFKGNERIALLEDPVFRVPLQKPVDATVDPREFWGVVVEAKDTTRLKETGPTEILGDVPKLVISINEDKIEFGRFGKGGEESLFTRGAYKMDGFGIQPVAGKVFLDRLKLPREVVHCINDHEGWQGIGAQAIAVVHEHVAKGSTSGSTDLQMFPGQFFLGQDIFQALLLHWGHLRSERRHAFRGFGALHGLEDAKSGAKRETITGLESKDVG